MYIVKDNRDVLLLWSETILLFAMCQLP